MNETDDDTLIQSYLAGDNDSFNIIYERYKLPLYSYLNKLFDDRTPVIDDIFQQTWLNAIRNMDKYKNRERFLAWLMRIAHNLVMDYFRNCQRRNEDEFDPVKESFTLKSGEADPLKSMEMQDLAERLEQALAALSPELREVFLLRQRDLSFREIAAIQKCSVNTCLARMRYAVKNLRDKLRFLTINEEYNIK